MSRCLIIINPTSGGGAARRYIMDLELQLNKLFDHVEIKFTEGPYDATRFAKEATEAHYDAVFCMGGDGTVNETVNGIAQAGGDINFGFIPVGTVNDMSRALKIPRSPRAAIRALAHSKIKCIDIGRCNDTYFCNNLAAGIIPKVIEEVTIKEKRILGPLAYFAKGGHALLNNKNYSYRIQLEDKDFIVKSPLVLALLTNCVSSFEKFMPTAKVDDGLMRLMVFKSYFIFEIFRIIPLVLSGSIYNSEYVDIYTVKKANIQLLEDGSDIATNMDGDKGPDLPVELEVLPKFLRVYVPDKTYTKKKSSGLLPNPVKLLPKI